MGRIEDLERRVAALEGTADSGRTEAASLPAPKPAPDLRQLKALRLREGSRYVREDMRGAVTYAGSALLGDRELMWAREHGVPEVCDLEPAGVARLLAALGHPSRLALVRDLLTGPRTSRELQAVIGSGSAGQLYHHLKDLIAAGIVGQSGRSCYQIAVDRVIPLLVILAASGDIGRSEGTQDESAPAQAEQGD